MRETKYLSKEQMRELKDAFRNYDGRLNSKQTWVLSSHNIAYDGRSGTSHVVLRHSPTGKSINFAFSPSDWRIGRNMAQSLIKFIEEANQND